MCLDSSIADLGRRLELETKKKLQGFRKVIARR
jgi:hypothetical protein